MTDKDQEQDRIIRDNSVRITRNEEAIKRQTEALEQIRDHYYPPPDGWWKRAFSFFIKVVCVIVAYLGIAQTVDWIWNAREADTLASRYADVARRLYRTDGDIPGAISCLEKASKIDPKESEYKIQLTFLDGMAIAADYLTNDRPLTDAERARITAALADATVLRELEPKNPMPCVLMAQAYLLSGEKEDAVAAVESAVALAPKLAPVRVSACAVQYLTGHVEAAREHLAEAERLDASLPLVMAWKGTFALETDGDPAGARTCFEAMIRRSPRLPPAHMYLAQALLQEKNPDLAQVRAAFSRALQLNSKLKGAMLGMAKTYELEDNPVLARLWLDRLLAVDGKYLPALADRARQSGKLGDWPAAVADLTAALKLAPFRADLYRLRAEAAEKAGDAARAKDDRRTAGALEAEAAKTKGK